MLLGSAEPRPLRRLPCGLHLGERAVGGRLSSHPQALARRRRSGARTWRWRAQACLRVEIELARQIGEHEQQIAHLVRPAAPVGASGSSARSSASSSSSLSSTAAASGQSKPTRAARAVSLAARVRAGRPAGTPASAPVSAPGGALGRFLRLPGRGLCRGVAGRGVAEDVRMAAHHLVGDGPRDVDEVEPTGFLGHARVIDDLEQQVAEFVRQRGEVARARSRRRPRRLPRSCRARWSRRSAPCPTGSRARVAQARP